VPAVDLHQVAVTVGCLVPAVVLHECAHGVAAYACGDDTAKKAGRLSLNPARHVDPFGSLLLPALMALTSVGVLGYAKPVPVRPSRMRSPRNGALLTALAGPATNLVLALVAAVAIRLLHPDELRAFDPDRMSLGLEILLTFGFLNVILGVFNLLPLPPLDGSAFVERVLPRSWWPRWLRLRQYAPGILLVVILLAPQILRPLFDRSLDAWARLLS